MATLVTGVTLCCAVVISLIAGIRMYSNQPTIHANLPDYREMLLEADDAYRMAETTYDVGSCTDMRAATNQIDAIINKFPALPSSYITKLTNRRVRIVCKMASLGCDR
jgi:hypothetical protein